ncbi:MAG: DUF6115 domain-containing protein [Limnochordia bacterium]|jgi:hypothetical protein
MLSAMIAVLLLIVIGQLHGLRRLLEERLVSQQAQPTESFADILDQELDDKQTGTGWEKMRDEVKKMAAEGQPVPVIARTLGVGQGEVQLLLDLDDNTARG